MRNLAGLAAGEVTERFPMPPGARDMLDIGGSHGYFSVSLCRKQSNRRRRSLQTRRWAHGLRIGLATR